MTSADEVHLQKLLKELSPALIEGEFVFLTFPDARYGDYASLEPIAAFTETEGLTLVVPRRVAEVNGNSYDGVFSAITLRVHSNLSAVGLTAAVSKALSVNNISANVIAAFYHDHIFVASHDADSAMDALLELSDLADSCV